jgi:hypothetical protein
MVQFRQSHEPPGFQNHLNKDIARFLCDIEKWCRLVLLDPEDGSTAHYMEDLDLYQYLAQAVCSLKQEYKCEVV